MTKSESATCALLILWFIAVVCAAIAVGILFGAAYAFVVLGLVALYVIVKVTLYARKLEKEGGD